MTTATQNPNPGNNGEPIAAFVGSEHEGIWIVQRRTKGMLFLMHRSPAGNREWQITEAEADALHSVEDCLALRDTKERGNE